MQQLDAYAINALGIPRLLLMDHAGLAVARAVATLLPQPSAPLLVCCGTGYNGGDGFAAARHLHGVGYGLRVLLVGKRDHLRDEPRVFAGILDQLGAPLATYEEPGRCDVLEPWLADCGLIVDALLGIGLRGEVKEPARTVIARINASGKPVVSADIPSGLDGDTGVPHGVAVQATVTVTFGWPKQGCVAKNGQRYTGRLVVDPITMPPEVFTAP